MSQLIDLTQTRKIVIKDRGRQYGFEVPPIPESVWFAYFDAIVSTSERRGNEIVQNVDASSAGIELAGSAISAGFCDDERWDDLKPEQIPLAHRLAVASVLTSAFAADERSPGHEEYSSDVVSVHSLWSANEKGAMRRHKDLLHFFQTPTAEQNRRYRRDDSRAQVIGGSRRGTTVYHGAQRTLAALYDELIVSVFGYAIGGKPLSGTADIKRHMDTYHKVSAVVKLFAPAEVEIEEDEAGNES